MDPTKTAIKSLVLDLRKSLEADVEVGLRRYGITPTALRPVESLAHLDDRGKTARIRMEEGLRHEMERSAPGSLAEAVHWFVREVAFTHLNRLVGLKALEVRGLTPEVIQTRAEFGNRSRALRDYREEHPAAASLADDGLEEAIKAACRQIYPEFRLLFDVGDPAEMREAPVNSLVWPSTPTLKGCIAKINELDAKVGRAGAPAYGKASAEQSLWAEDEIIGWVYQFYNAEEKVSIRDKGKPQHPAEVAVINQFFTPRWIVKFLVDNTLGRLWLEMHADSPRVRAKCDYLVEDPHPALPQKESTFGGGGKRKAKRPQDIRLIDPACGTMHFGHYAFEVFQAMYADAREQGWVRGADALSEADVPAAILSHNLYGVDIDLRAVQLAALSLFMKAKSANPEMRIERVNLVVADAHLPHGKVREDFLAQYKGEPVIQKAFAEVFESLDNVAEVGSLLRVEERFRQALEAGGYQSKTPKKKKNEADTLQAAFAEIAPGWSLEHTVEQMLGHLREFARRALREHDLNAQLFAGETEKSVALLDVFLHEYDVVVMNPPFGGTLESASSTLRKSYVGFCNNILCAFVERAVVDLARNGYVGAVLDRTFLLKVSYETFRREILLKKSRVVAYTDLGWNILDDASVEVSTLVLEANKPQALGVFLRAPKDITLSEQPNPVSLLEPFTVPVNDFATYPNASFAYWTPKFLRGLFQNLPSIDPVILDSKDGIRSNDSERFHRFYWEIDRNQIGRGKIWAPLANGGSYSPYYRDNYQVIFYENDAALIRSLRGMRSDSYQFREGITWGERTDLISFQYLASGHAFTQEGMGLFFKDEQLLWPLLGVINTNLIRYITNTLCGQHKYATYIGQLPYQVLSAIDKEVIGSLAKEIHNLKAIWDIGNETCTRFKTPWLVQLAKGQLQLPKIVIPSLSGKQELSLPNYLEIVLSVEQVADKHLQNLQNEIDQSVYGLYEISTEDQSLVERELGKCPPEVIWGYADKLTQEQKASEHVARLMSYCLLTAIQADADGILPLTEASGHDTVLRHVQAGLEKHFGEHAAYQVELDSAGYLGRPLGEWLVKNFWKDFHLKWYKNRPILWQLQSPKGHFACLVHIHKMDRDTLPKVRSQYLWPSRNACQAALESARLREDAGERSAAREVARLESMLEDLSDFEKRLTSVIEARVKCEIPAWAQGPYRNGVYDPVLDDGVAVNISPLQEAGLLAKNKVV